MYLHEPTTAEIVQKQLRFKLNANAASFTTLVVLQLVALLFSFPGMTSYFNVGDISIIEVSGGAHIAMAIVWALFSGVSLALHSQWNEAFTFVTTRYSHHLSNLMYMLIASLIAAVVTTLTGPALRLLSIIRYKEVSSITSTVSEAPVDFLIQFVTLFSYLFLLFIVGYTIRAVIFSNQQFGGLLFIMIFLGLFIVNVMFGVPVVDHAFFFFVQESSLLIFLLKVIGTSALLFSTSVYMTNRLEVRN